MDVEQNLEVRVAVLERELMQISGLFDRLDATLEKLTDVSQSINQLLAVHEMKLNQHDSTHQDIYRQFDKRSETSSSQHEAINNSIKNLKQEIDGMKISNVKKFSLVDSWKSLLIGAGIVILYILQATNNFGLFPH